MTRRANARIAGITFLVYIAAGLTSLSGAADAAADVVLWLIQCFCALVLAVTLYAITCDQDRHLALLAFACRVGEGLIAAMFIPASLALRSLDAGASTSAPDAAAVHALASFVRGARATNVLVSATFFAAGSTLFSWLFLRGRIVPAALAWLGLFASLLMIVTLPLQLGGILRGRFTMLFWMPMLAFEVTLAFWLLLNGAAPPARPIAPVPETP
jgi:Domain of unknown function (DUF4386)